MSLIVTLTSITSLSAHIPFSRWTLPLRFLKATRASSNSFRSSQKETRRGSWLLSFAPLSCTHHRTGLGFPPASPAVTCSKQALTEEPSQSIRLWLLAVEATVAIRRRQ